MAHAKIFKTEMITIELGGEVRSLFFDLNAFAELEKRFGTIQQAMEALQSGSLTALRTVLWAGLIHAYAILDEVTGEPTGYSVTPHAVGSWVNPALMADVAEQLGKAITSAMPEDAAAPKQAITKNV